MYGGFSIIPKNPYTNTQRLFNEKRELVSLSFSGITYDIDSSNNLLTINHPQMGASIVTTSLGSYTVTDEYEASELCNNVNFTSFSQQIIVLSDGDEYDKNTGTLTLSNVDIINNISFTDKFNLYGQTLVTPEKSFTSDVNDYYLVGTGYLYSASGTKLNIIAPATMTLSGDIDDNTERQITINSLTSIKYNSVDYYPSVPDGSSITVDELLNNSNVNIVHNGYYEQSDITYNASYITLTIDEDCTWFELMFNFSTYGEYTSIDIKIGETTLASINPSSGLYLKVAKVNDAFIII